MLCGPSPVSIECPRPEDGRPLLSPQGGPGRLTAARELLELAQPCLRILSTPRIFVPGTPQTVARIYHQHSQLSSGSLTTMHLGLDLGTSSVKAILLANTGEIAGQASAPVPVSHPHPLWSEQNPRDWWHAATTAIGVLRRDHDLARVRGIGLSGQMHGAVLLDHADRVLRPAILWNDGRAYAECAMLEATEPRSRAITGNLAMPGFTAPKLLWARRHEPEIAARIRRVLLPKDWLRLRMTGEAISDMSDAAGTLWLDVAARRWSPAMLAATGLDESHMPALVEGTAIAGRLRANIAADWGLPAGIPVAGGGGDNAAGAIGIGCIAPGQAFVSLGTSGVIFVADAQFLPDPDRAVHAFCHCLPNMWHRMSVILSAAGSLAWLVRATGRRTKRRC